MVIRADQVDHRTSACLDMNKNLMEGSDDH